MKQSFSHGRSNTVVVEVKRRRVLGKPGEAEAPKIEAEPPAPPAPAPKPAPARPAATSNETPRERQERLLRDAEEQRMGALEEARRREDREKRSEEHTSELQSLMRISYAVFCLKKKKKAIKKK